MRTAVFTLALSSLLAPEAAAGVLFVPSQHTTIASALAAARSGDKIFVSAGTYKENLKWPSADGIELIGLDGPTRCILDGGGTSRVIEMQGKHTRATRIEGFTITGGTMKTTRNYGAGIHVNGGSPLLRDLIVRGNLGDGPNWNYGGGLYVTGSGARPRIEFCRFENNVLQNGSWNYGAGVFSDSSSSVEIVACHFENNRNLQGSRGYGGAVYIRGSARVSLISSSVFTKNLCQTGSWNHGGAVHVAGVAYVIGNSFVANVVTGGNWAYGGAFAQSSRTASVVANNIFHSGQAKNGGGVSVTSSSNPSPVLSNNCFWRNQGGDYHNCKAGPGDFAKDPLFIPNTFRLTGASPCIDAGTWDAKWTGIVFDQDGQVRRLDGNRDGLAGNGAQCDIGADEFGSEALAFTTPPQIGKVSQLDVQGRPGDLFALFLDFQRGELYVPPFGEFALGAPTILLGGGVVPAKPPFVVPNANDLRGARVWLQALQIGLGSKVTGAFTGPVEGLLR